MGSITNTIGPPGAGDETQLELINNISNLFQDLESKHSQTRNLLDLLAGFILRKFENDPDFPLQEISNILGLCCEICHENFSSFQDLRYHSTMAHCWIPLQRIDSENLTSQTEMECESQSFGKIEIPEEPVAEIDDEFSVPIQEMKLEPDSEYSLAPAPILGQRQEDFQMVESILLKLMDQQTEIKCHDKLIPKHTVESTTTFPKADPQIPTTADAPNSKIKLKTPYKRGKHGKNPTLKKYKFPCPYENCDKTCSTVSNLNVHIRYRHTGDKPFICSWPSCPWKFTSAVGLDRHCRTHTGDKPYQCDVCLNWFSRRYYLSRHKKNAHKQGSMANQVEHFSNLPMIDQIEVPENEPVVEITVPTLNPSSPKSEKAYSGYLPESEQLLTNSTILVQGQEHEQDFRMDPVLLVEQKQFHEKLAPKPTTFLKTQIPALLALPPKPTTNIKDSRKDRKHERKSSKSNESTGSYTNKFPCTYEKCDKIFLKLCYLKQHVSRHSVDKPYICSWPNCTWKFLRAEELTRHYRTHTGDKPFQCNICHERFPRSDHLSKHKAKAHIHVNQNLV